MTNPPNIVLLVCDQLRAFDLGCYGHPSVQTPHLDAFAAQGIRFATAISNNPVCTPARSILLSGQYSRTCNGVTGNSQDPLPGRNHLLGPSLPATLQAAGYETALIGKWHMPSAPDTVGFDHWVYPSYQHRHTQRRYFDAERPAGYTVDGWTWDYDHQRLCQWLDMREEKPFFLFYNIEPPHMPLGPDHIPASYHGRHSPQTVPVRPNVPAELPAKKAHFWYNTYTDISYFWQTIANKNPEPVVEDSFGIRDLTAYYLDMITLVDDLAGRFLDELDSRGLAENTIVLFTSDHGDNLGSHAAFNKGSFWEESIRVPMMVRWPAGLQPRVEEHQLAQLLDVAPTLLGLANLGVPQEVQGHDLTPVLTGEVAQVGDNEAFIEATCDGIAIRTPTHLYGMALHDNSFSTHTADNDRIVDDRKSFYDLRVDPYQETNLAKTTEQAELADALRTRLTNWHQQTLWAEKPPNRTPS